MKYASYDEMSAGDVVLVFRIHAIRIPVNRPDYVCGVLSHILRDYEGGAYDAITRTTYTSPYHRAQAMLTSFRPTGQVGTGRNRWEWSPMYDYRGYMVWDRAKVEAVMAEYGMEWHETKEWFLLEHYHPIPALEAYQARCVERKAEWQAKFHRKEIVA